MSALQIEHEQTARGGRYVGRMVGVAEEAEATYTRRATHLISADHTEAPGSMRGTGAALALVTRMVEDARASGDKILPLCSYVVAQFAKHPGWADVLAQR